MKNFQVFFFVILQKFLHFPQYSTPQHKLGIIDEKAIGMILKAKSKLKQSDNFRNVYIEKDLTASEREKNKRLRKELYEKRNEGNSWFIIRGGKVVEVEYRD